MAQGYFYHIFLLRDKFAQNRVVGKSAFIERVNPYLRNYEEGNDG